jgi:hypothetical protein
MTKYAKQLMVLILLTEFVIQEQPATSVVTILVYNRLTENTFITLPLFN